MNPVPEHWYDIGGWIAWLIDEAKLFLIWVLEQCLSAVVSVIDAIPLPSWVDNIGTLQLPDALAWAVHAFEIPYGASVIASAYVIRFLIRRIPIIG